jgi:hypothetical protein
MTSFRSSLTRSSRARRLAAVLPALVLAAGTLHPEVAAAGQSYTALTAMGSPASPAAWNGQSNGQWDVISEARDLDAAATGAVPSFNAGHAADCS